MTAARAPRLLVVDDAPNLREMMVRALTFAGYAVDEAGDGVDAVEAALRHPPDLVVIDVMMPRLDGFAAVAQMRAAALSCPAVFVTAADLTDEQVNVIAGAGDVLLAKPFGVDQLLDAVRTLLAARRR